MGASRPRRRATSRLLHIELPYHWRACGESLWGRPLGDDLYELQNVPFLAYGLNLGDIVKATPDGAGISPEVREVMIPSGHRTVRLFFAERLRERRMFALLDHLSRLSVGFKRGTRTCFALDVSCEADIYEVLECLEQWRRRGWCAYETGEQRAPGTFDDRPGEQVH